jgi:hypothetical protein
MGYILIKCVIWRQYISTLHRFILIKCCIMRSFIVRVLRQILLGWLFHGWWDRRGPEHAWKIWEIHIKFWSENPEEIDHLEDLGVDTKIILK